MDITNTAVEVLEHCESGEEDTVLEKVGQGELEVKTTHDLPGAPQGGPVHHRNMSVHMNLHMNV